MIRDNEGRFKQVHSVWSPRNREDGFISLKGRYMVYHPSHPRASSAGYVLRAIVHWEYYNKGKVGKNHDVHHKNRKRLDDSKENLIRLTKRQHHRIHNMPVLVELTCLQCKKKFTMRKWRLREKDVNRGKYCSQRCYHKYPYDRAHRENIGKGLKKAYNEGRR